ncbi:MAG TPA: acyl-CoA dehydrogenase family protein, partial [Pilimelia sp.]|nr:acyl-CoA dehydrogenase family protein [Pilimelia sp.]
LATVVPLLAAGAEGGGGSGPVAGAAAATLAGRQVTALAVTDAGSGSDLTALDTTVRLGDELVLTGAKRWITNAVGADAYLVLARHRPGRHFTSFSLVLVPATAPGVRATPADTPLFAGGGVGHVELAGVRLPRDHLVGAPGRGLAAFARHLATERLAGALWGVALCRRAITATRDRMAARAYGDGALWDLDPVRATLADCVVRTRQLDALCRALEERVARTWDAAGAALLKAAAADVAERVLTACAHLHGADGFAASGLHQLRAEAAVLGTGGGATEVALGLVADDLDRALADLDRPGPDPADRDRADPDRADPAGVPR